MTNPYASLSDEAIHQMIADLNHTLRERHNGVSPRTLPSFTSPDSPNFMGIGMSLTELLMSGEVERNLRAWHRQDRPEQERRLDLVLELAVELVEIKKQTHFSTSLARAAVQDVVQGDWRAVRQWAEHFAFKEERHLDMARPAAIYAKFREILARAASEAPPLLGIETPVQVPS